MAVTHIHIILPPYPRGFHIITMEVLKEVGELPQDGILNLFIKHTSAGLTINEAEDSDVLTDYESIFNRLVPEGMSFLQHTVEGVDDMPAHIKSSLVGSSISIPIIDHKLQLGTWQGIYLCEFRNRGGSRKLIASIIS